MEKIIHRTAINEKSLFSGLASKYKVMYKDVYFESEEMARNYIAYKKAKSHPYIIVSMPIKNPENFFIWSERFQEKKEAGLIVDLAKEEFKGKFNILLVHLPHYYTKAWELVVKERIVKAHEAGLEVKESMFK